MPKTRVLVSNNLIQKAVAELRDNALRVGVRLDLDLTPPALRMDKNSYAAFFYDGTGDTNYAKTNSPIKIVTDQDAAHWSNLKMSDVRRILAVWLGMATAALTFIRQGVPLTDSEYNEVAGFDSFQLFPSVAALFMRPTAFKTLTTAKTDQVWMIGTPPYIPKAILASVRSESISPGLEFSSLVQSDFTGVHAHPIGNNDCPRVYAHMIAPGISDDGYMQEVHSHRKNWLYGSNCVHVYGSDTSSETPGSKAMQKALNADHTDGYQSVTSRSIGYELWWPQRHKMPSRTAATYMDLVANDDLKNSYIYGSANRLTEVLLAHFATSAFKYQQGLTVKTSLALSKYLKWEMHTLNLTNTWYYWFNGYLFPEFRTSMSTLAPKGLDIASLPQASGLKQSDIYTATQAVSLTTKQQLQNTPWLSSAHGMISILRSSTDIKSWQPRAGSSAVRVQPARRGKKVYSISTGGKRSSLTIAVQEGVGAPGSDTVFNLALPVHPVLVDGRAVLQSGLVVRFTPAELPENRVYAQAASGGALGMDTLGPWATGETETVPMTPVKSQTFFNRRVTTPREDGDYYPNLTLLEKLSFSLE